MTDALASGAAPERPGRRRRLGARCLVALAIVLSGTIAGSSGAFGGAPGSACAASGAHVPIVIDFGTVTSPAGPDRVRTAVRRRRPRCQRERRARRRLRSSLAGRRPATTHRASCAPSAGTRRARLRRPQRLPLPRTGPTGKARRSGWTYQSAGPATLRPTSVREGRRRGRGLALRRRCRRLRERAPQAARPVRPGGRSAGRSPPPPRPPPRRPRAPAPRTPRPRRRSRVAHPTPARPPPRRGAPAPPAAPPRRRPPAHVDGAARRRPRQHLHHARPAIGRRSPSARCRRRPARTGTAPPRTRPAVAGHRNAAVGLGIGIMAVLAVLAVGFVQTRRTHP